MAHWIITGIRKCLSPEKAFQYIFGKADGIGYDGRAILFIADLLMTDSEQHQQHSI